MGGVSSPATDSEATLTRNVLSTLVPAALCALGVMTPTGAAYNSLTPEELQLDMMRQYPGHFVIGRDLDVY